MICVTSLCAIRVSAALLQLRNLLQLLQLSSHHPFTQPIGLVPLLSGMSAILETSLGDIVIDLLVDESPKACEK